MNVADNSAVFCVIEKPGWAVLGIHPVRTHSDRLYYPANGTGLHQFSSLHRRPVFQALTEHDRLNALHFRLHTLDFGKLIQKGDARLVGHVILAMLHHADSQRRALLRDDGTQDKLNRWIVHDLVFTCVPTLPEGTFP